MPPVGLTDPEILLPPGGFGNATGGVNQAGNLIPLGIFPRASMPLLVSKIFIPKKFVVLCLAADQNASG